MPFRTARKQQVAEKPETGAVAEMVRQFADPYAFVRELVQNSIDAGATGLNVRVERAGGIATTALHDDGSGMTRETIDGPLLTLFNSSKEGDSSKIGKYGVGFVSVFAIDPETVEVDTWRDGQRHRVRLFRDHRYEMEKLAPLEDSGTVVTLHQPMDAEKFDEHRRRLENALSRWCRFAAIPIEISSVDHDRNDPATTRRIDMPLSVPSPLYVQAHRDNECIVVGPTMGTSHYLTSRVADDDPAKTKTTFAGFYNRGLTLFETDEPLHPVLTNVRLRVDSPHLRHTLSRDNVLRDRAFDRIIAKARELVEKSLRRELISRLGRAACDLAESEPPYDAELLASYVAFLEAALLPPFSLPSKQIMFPLAATWRKSSTISLERIMSQKITYVASAKDDLCKALAKVDVPVALAPHPAIHMLLALRIPLPGAINPDNDFVLVHELPPEKMSASDQALCLALESHLLMLGLQGDHVGIAQTSGDVDAPCIRMQRHARHIYGNEWLYAKDIAGLGWGNFDLSGPVFLVATNEAVQLAREHAAKDTVLAAHILLRMILLSHTDTHGKLADALFTNAAMEIV